MKEPLYLYAVLIQFWMVAPVLTAITFARYYCSHTPSMNSVDKLLGVISSIRYAHTAPGMCQQTFGAQDIMLLARANLDMFDDAKRIYDSVYF